MFFGRPPTQLYYTPNETPFSQLSPSEQTELEKQAPTMQEMENTFQRVKQVQAEVQNYVLGRHHNRAAKLIAESEKQLQNTRITVGTRVQVRTELPNRHGSVKLRKKFDAPLRSDAGTVVEHTKSNRYKIRFDNGEETYYARRWLKPIISSEAHVSNEPQEVGGNAISQH